MDKDFKKNILKFLEIIEYADDKEEYIKNLEETIALEAIENLTFNLTPQKRGRILNRLAKGKTRKDALGIIENELSVEDYEKALLASSTDVFTNIVEEASQSIDAKTQKKLDWFLEDLVKEPTSKVATL